MGIPVDRAVVMEHGVAGSNVTRFYFLIIFLFFSNLKGGGYIIKKLKIIVISLPKDSFASCYV